MTGRNIARYIRVNQLEQSLKKQLDDGELSLVSAVELSHLSPKEQKTISKMMEQGKIKLNANTVKCIKALAGNVTEKSVLEHVGHKKEKKRDACKAIQLSSKVYERYFADVRDEDVAGIVEEALEAWFIESRGREVVY